jgi:hypothetical protein
VAERGRIRTSDTISSLKRRQKLAGQHIGIWHHSTISRRGPSPRASARMPRHDSETALDSLTRVGSSPDARAGGFASALPTGRNKAIVRIGVMGWSPRHYPLALAPASGAPSWGWGLPHRKRSGGQWRWCRGAAPGAMIIFSASEQRSRWQVCTVVSLALCIPFATIGHFQIRDHN